jgi:hypothetical protein
VSCDSLTVSSKVWFHMRHTLSFIDHFLNLFSFHGGRIQCNVLGQTAVSGLVGFPTFRDLTPSPSSGYAGGFAAPKLTDQFWCCPRKFHYFGVFGVFDFTQPRLVAGYQVSGRYISSIFKGSSSPRRNSLDICRIYSFFYKRILV